MDAETAVRALGALAQDTRLAVFRRLVVAGPDGIPAGALAADLGVPAPTLSFHLKELETAGLARRARNGRMIYCSANYETMRDLLMFLSEDCCGGRPEICSDLGSICDTSCDPAAQATPQAAKTSEPV